MIQIDVDTTEHLKVFEFATASQLVNQALEKSKLVNSQTNNIKGIPSGLTEFDKISNGFIKTELSTFAIKKGMGKTAFLLSLINNIAVKNKFSLGILSPERSSKKFITRIIETETGISIEKLNSSEFSELKRYQLGKTINEICHSKIFIDDTHNFHTKDIYDKISFLKNTHKVDIIFIDSFNLFKLSSYENKSHDEQLNEIMISLKNISKEFELPIVLFYQIEKPLNEIFHFKKPGLEDLPDYIKHLSDNIYLINRTDLPYRIDEKIYQNEYCELHIMKHTNNVQKEIKLKFLPSIDKFIDYL